MFRRSLAPRFALCSVLLAGASAVALAQSTIATFADPAADASTPLFDFDGSTLTGGWSSTGLTLLTPASPLPDFDDVTFSMTPLTASGAAPFYSLGGGTIEFFDGVDLLMRIEFDGGTLAAPFGFGSSEFASQNVVFSGPIVPPGLSGEAFAFSFANPVGSPSDFTVTASFTSSAIPEPASMLLVLLGVPMAIRHRR